MKNILVYLLLVVTLFIGCSKEEKIPNNSNKIEKNYSLLEIQARNNKYTYKNKPITLEEYLNIQNMIAEIYFKSELKNLSTEELKYKVILALTDQKQGDKLIKPIAKLVEKEKYKSLNWKMTDNLIVIEGNKINTILTLKTSEEGNVEVLNIAQYTKDGEFFIMDESAYALINKILPINDDLNEKLGFDLKNKEVDRILTKDKYRNDVVVKKIVNSKNGLRDEETSLYDIYQNIVKKEKYNQGELEEITVFLPDGSVEKNEKYKSGNLEKLVKYRGENIALEIIPSKNIYVSYDKQNKKNGVIDEVLGTYEETMDNKKVVGKVIDKFTLNRELKGNIDSLKEAYVNLINGVVKIETYSNDTLVGREFYENGIKIMEYNEWHENGKQRVKGNYKNGRENGEWIEYNEKGQAVKISYYENSDSIRVIEGDSDGILKRKYHIFRKTGEYIGEYKEYHKNGVVKQEGIYRNEIMHSEFTEKDGRWKEYNSKGKVIKIENYSYGKLNSTIEYNYKTGIAKVKNGNYVKEYKSPKYYYIKKTKEYQTIPTDDNKDILKMYTEINGKKDGYYAELYENTGKRMIDGNYKNGLKDGEWKEYDKTGSNILKTTFYIDGRDINEIERTSNYENIEFYPSGRIKYISDGPEEYSYEDLPIDFKALKKQIDDISKEVENYKVVDGDNGEHFSWQLADIRIMLEGLNLSKNLNNEEKNELNKLIKTLEKTHEEAQKLWSN